jgi:hypothetical protein
MRKRNCHKKRASVFREALAGASDEALMEDWSLLAGGQIIFTKPRAARRLPEVE